MLTLLSLKNFVIVPSLTVEPQKGLTCLTGETGAGKSILLDALQFVLGARSDISLIREGQEKTEVAAEFSRTEKALFWLKENDLEEDESILLRRTLDTGGRTRCSINGTPVTVSQLKELAEFLVDIHGQHAHQSLLKTAYQLNLVDDFGNANQTLARVRVAWDAWQTALTRLTNALNEKEKLQAETERLSWINETLEELNPKPEEWETLSSEHAILSNAADIVTNVRGAMENLTDAETNAARLLSLAEMQLTHAAKFDETYADYAKALNQAASIVEDTARDISHHIDHCNLDEDRFDEIDERLNAFWRVSRKFHRAPEDILQFWNETKDRLAELAAFADLEALKRDEEKARHMYMESAALLTKERKEAASLLSASVTQEMQHLSMTGGSLVVNLVESDPWAGGLERCEFLIAGHAGATPRPLTKVASGGELARISLAIAVITAEVTPVPTLVFDEVDSGIGGAVAEVVGHLLKKLGRTRQVLCVTHLPQVASCADNQWQVTKATEEGVTTSELKVLSSQERVDEIARMLGGITITEATKKAASEMLRN